MVSATEGCYYGSNFAVTSHHGIDSLNCRCDTQNRNGELFCHRHDLCSNDFGSVSNNL